MTAGGRCTPTASETVSDELELAGRATVIDDPRGPRDLVRRAAAIAAYGRFVADDHVLVELGIERLLLARFTTPPSWPPAYRRWRPAGYRCGFAPREVRVGRRSGELAGDHGTWAEGPATAVVPALAETPGGMVCFGRRSAPVMNVEDADAAPNQPSIHPNG